MGWSNPSRKRGVREESSRLGLAHAVVAGVPDAPLSLDVDVRMDSLRRGDKRDREQQKGEASPARYGAMCPAFAAVSAPSASARSTRQVVNPPCERPSMRRFIAGRIPPGLCV